MSIDRGHVQPHVSLHEQKRDSGGFSLKSEHECREKMYRCRPTAETTGFYSSVHTAYPQKAQMSLHYGLIGSQSLLHVKNKKEMCKQNRKHGKTSRQGKQECDPECCISLWVTSVRYRLKGKTFLLLLLRTERQKTALLEAPSSCLHSYTGDLFQCTEIYRGSVKVNGNVAAKYKEKAFYLYLL